MNAFNFGEPVRLHSQYESRQIMKSRNYLTLLAGECVPGEQVTKPQVRASHRDVLKRHTKTTDLYLCWDWSVTCRMSFRFRRGRQNTWRHLWEDAGNVWPGESDSSFKGHVTFNPLIVHWLSLPQLSYQGYFLCPYIQCYWYFILFFVGIFLPLLDSRVMTGKSVVFLSNLTTLIHFLLPLQVEKSCGIPEEEDHHGDIQTIMLSHYWCT